MIQDIEITNRLAIIRSLESVKFRLISTSKEGTYELDKFYIFCNVDENKLDPKLAAIYRGSKNSQGKEFDGRLADIFDQINIFIAEQLAPFITEQKEAIKKLL